MVKDSVLLNEVAKGNMQSFRVLYNRFATRVYSTALNYSHNREDAEEIVQDIFAEVYRSAGKFHHQSQVGTWIYRFAVNKCIDFLRKKKTKKRFGFIIESTEKNTKPDFDHPGVLLQKKEDAKLIFGAIDTLHETQKTAFILSFIEELPRQQVADTMGVTLKAVEALLQRAKKNLAKKLEYHYPHRKKKRK